MADKNDKKCGESCCNRRQLLSEKQLSGVAGGMGIEIDPNTFNPVNYACSAASAAAAMGMACAGTMVIAVTCSGCMYLQANVA